CSHVLHLQGVLSYQADRDGHCHSPILLLSASQLSTASDTSCGAELTMRLKVHTLCTCLKRY
ncbi:hypothetical protein COCVIDRAFT_113877, partial [Bipolaris victoriae FI3]